MIDSAHILSQEESDLVVYAFGKEACRFNRRDFEQALERVDQIPTDVEHTLAVLSGEAARRRTAHQLSWVTVLLAVCVLWTLVVLGGM
ncbi:MAG: hypothetical protein AAFV46_00065 [Cyanobacteria bacterium J06635_11]